MDGIHAGGVSPPPENVPVRLCVLHIEVHVDPCISKAYHLMTDTDNRNKKKKVVGLFSG